MQKNAAFLPGYCSTITEVNGKERYLVKLRLLDGLDPYEVKRDDWKDDIGLWPNLTHIHVGMYLLLHPSAYSKEDLLNYKSMDCYVNFLSGWMREVLVKTVADNRLRIIIAKVSA